MDKIKLTPEITKKISIDISKTLKDIKNLEKGKVIDLNPGKSQGAWEISYKT